MPGSKTQEPVPGSSTIVPELLSLLIPKQGLSGKVQWPLTKGPGPLPKSFGPLAKGSTPLDKGPVSRDKINY